jgi:hypothetical protein
MLYTHVVNRGPRGVRSPLGGRGLAPIGDARGRRLQEGTSRGRLLNGLLASPQSNVQREPVLSSIGPVRE